MVYKTVDKGDADFFFEIGELFQQIPGFGNDIAEPYYAMAIEQYTLTAEKRVADAQFKLGELYELGIGFKNQK